MKKIKAKRTAGERLNDAFSNKPSSSKEERNIIPNANAWAHKEVSKQGAGWEPKIPATLPETIVEVIPALVEEAKTPASERTIHHAEMFLEAILPVIGPAKTGSNNQPTGDFGVKKIATPAILNDSISVQAAHAISGMGTHTSPDVLSDSGVGSTLEQVLGDNGVRKEDKVTWALCSEPFARYESSFREVNEEKVKSECARIKAVLQYLAVHKAENIAEALLETYGERTLRNLVSASLAHTKAAASRSQLAAELATAGPIRRAVLMSKMWAMDTAAQAVGKKAPATGLLDQYTQLGF